MEEFLELYSKAALTTLGLFWMAFWAFGLGYLVSSMIQVFVTRERMKKAMGKAEGKSLALGTFFGFISSSCSFAALATTRSLFTKGAGFIPSLAFLLASTNLVIELGIIIAVFLSWQFVVGEYVGGLILILLMWALVKVTKPKKLIEKAREHAKEETDEKDEEDIPNWKELISSKEGWAKVSERYVMEWRMVWKDVVVGFTVAGIIAAFVPERFFRSLFIGSGSDDPTFWELLAQAIVGPIAAFFTFIGSMGNIPLAAVLFGNGVAFAGIMAFIFSDLVVFPVLRIQAKYYGWKMACYILVVFLAILVATSLIMHYSFDLLGMLPDPSSAKNVTDRTIFKVDYTFFLNILFAVLSAGFLIWKAKLSGLSAKKHQRLSEKILFVLAIVAFIWLAVGCLLSVFS